MFRKNILLSQKMSNKIERVESWDWVLVPLLPGRVNALNQPQTDWLFFNYLQLIQELKKENFDLKLRLYMEQKEREVSQ